jgi:hypothetical protein
VCRYAFLELRSIEEASNAMAFDGILFNDVNLKVGFRMRAGARVLVGGGLGVCGGLLFGRCSALRRRATRWRFTACITPV